MVQPVTVVNESFGPFTDANRVNVYLKTISGKRQKRPYDLILPFRLDVYRRLYGNGSATSWSYGPPPATYPAAVDKDYQMAKNRAYEKLVAKLGESSSLGATLTAELKETWGMLTGTVHRILSAAKSIKRFRFANAAAELGIPYFERDRKVRVGWKYTSVNRRGVRRRERRGVYVTRTYMKFGDYREIEKSLANGWLMWSYGVKPLAQDLYNAMDHWGREHPQGERYSASARSKTVLDLGYLSSKGTLSVTIGVVLMCRVRVNNAELWNLNKLGLVNPAQWLLEALPFSFVVDWFSNLSQMIMSVTDLMGLSVTDAVTCEQHKIVETNDRNSISPKAFTPQGKERFTFRRSPGLVTPKLVFAYERFSWQRGLNAISLLVGFKP